MPPRLVHTVLDTPDVRGLAEFYRELLGLVYRPGDEPPADGTPDDADWLVLTEEDGTRRLAFQEVPELTPTTWPSHEVPMQLHLDMSLEVLLHRTDEPEELLYVLADPAGHPFCIFTG